MTPQENSAKEGNYMHLFKYNPIPMWIFDQKSLDFLDVNDAALNHYGYTREEFLKMNARDIRPESEVNALVEDIYSNQGTVNYAGDWLHKKKNGEIILVNIVSLPFIFQGQEARHVMATDITEQRKFQKELGNSEERFRKIVEGAPEPIIIQQNRKIVYVNPSGIKLFRASSIDDLVGKDFLEFVSPAERNIFLERIERIDDGTQPLYESYELHLIALDGTDVWVELSSQVIEYEGSKSRLAFLRDVSHHRKAAEAISYQEYLLQEMGSLAKIGGWEFDPETGEGTWTEETANIHGLSAKDSTSEQLGISFYTDESKNKVTEAIKRTLREKVPYDLELELVLEDGTRKWVHTLGKPVVIDNKVVKIRGAFQDITQRKNSERALIESEHRYRAFFENSHDAMILSTTDGKILEANQATCILLGYTEDEVKSLKLSALIDYEAKAYKKFIEKRAQSGKAVAELKLIKKGGGFFDAELSSALFYDAEGNQKSSVIIRDISDRKKNEKEINNLNKELELRIKERTAELSAVNKDLEAFAYSVSHDLRTPLRGINGLTQILNDNYSHLFDEEGVRLCSRIRSNSLKMSTLIDDLLAFSKASTAEIRKSEIDMNKLLDIVLAEIGEKRELKKVRIDIAKLPNAIGDAALLKQVWVNLLANAVKFTSKKDNPHIEVSGGIQDSSVYYSVKDNGAGFDMKYIDKIFVAFQRLHSEQDFQGTGAGLSIVKRILHKHGGQIWAEGEENKGAVFTFTLPV